jgi:hypothetical protein
MAKYRVMVETLGANPTHNMGDIIEDSGDQKSLYSIPYLLRIGAIEKMDDAGHAPAETDGRASSETAPSGPDMVVAPGEQMPKDDDDKQSHRASRR